MTFDIRHLLVYLCAALLAVAPVLAWAGSGDKCVRLVKDEDFNAAYHECKSAAEQGSADAQFNLGMMYFVGWGVIKDPQESYVWLLLAAHGGNENAQIIMNFIKDEKYLSHDQISTATEEAMLLAPGLDSSLSVVDVFAVMSLFLVLFLAVIVIAGLFDNWKNISTATKKTGKFTIMFMSIFLLFGFSFTHFTGFEVLPLMGAIIGPFFAVLASTLLHERWTKQERRQKLFNTLVALKKYALSYSRAQALNEVKLEFSEYDDVVEAWVKYVEYMENSDQVREEEEEEERYNALLRSMAKALGDESRDIHHSFAPQAHRNLEKLDVNWKTSLIRVLTGEEPIATRDSERGVAEALYLQGVRYRDGDGVSPNPEKAVRLFKEAEEAAKNEGP